MCGPNRPTTLLSRSTSTSAPSASSAGAATSLREAAEPGIRRVDPVLAARNERVGGHELFEPLPEAVDVDASSHSANAGMIDDPNASTSAEGSVYDSKWRM